MQSGPITFFHHHIKKNIEKVDKRTQAYIKRRKSFLVKYCEPLNEKILKLDKQIQYYKHLIENQNQMIQNEDEVKELKKQISEFLSTQKYFLQHLQQHQEKIIQLQSDKKLIQLKIKRIQQDIAGITRQKSDQVYKQLSQRDSKSMRSGFNNSRADNSRINFSRMNNSKVQSIEDYFSEQRSLKRFALPTIFKVDKYYVSKQTQKIKNNACLSNTKNKIINNAFSVDVCNHLNNFSGSAQNLIENNDHLKLRIKTNISQKQGEEQKTYTTQQVKQKQNYLKIRFKELLTSFNKFQLLFKDCFDKKKNHVQKSVSQLQSKLISNRDKFLEICESIANKVLVERISFQQFQSLSSDELMTLMISFPWIQKKMFKQLVDRKKQLIQLQGTKFL